MSRSRTPDYSILPGTQGGDLLGEGPWWHAGDQALHWVDSKGRVVHRSGLDGSDRVDVAAPEDLGFVIVDDRGDRIVGLRCGVHALRDRTFTPLHQADFDTNRHRLNDGKTDSRGRLWYGTMHDEESQPSAALYTLRGGSAVRVHGGVTTSNGIGWSRDGRTMYHTDSMAFAIWAYDYDPDAGEIHNRRLFASDSGYRPDGLTVDASDHVWSAKWEGGVVVHYDPTGAVVEVLTMPVSRPSSCMFGGENLDVLIVTSAKPVNIGSEPLAGSVFLVDPRTTGVAEKPFATEGLN